MCGRFYVDDETAREIQRTVRKVDEQLQRERNAQDIHPSECAAVITASPEGMTATVKRWGFPAFGSQKLLINARAESVLEKKLFRESILHRRLIIPAAGFYEWNSSKEKVTFTSADCRGKSPSTLFLAGFYNRYGEEDRFIILTTAANASVKDTHDRMPLLLKPYELEDWLWQDNRLEEFLRKEPHLLRKRVEYEQQILPFI